MQNKHFITALLIICWAFIGCSSYGYIDTRQMDLSTENKSDQILNLKFAGDAEKVQIEQAEKLVESGFLNRQSDKYGYYDIRFEVTVRPYTPITAFCAYIPALWPIYLFGVHTGGNEFSLVGHFYIFDSNGKMLKHYSNEATYRKGKNLYSGADATKRGSEEFTKLFDVIFAQAVKDSDEINSALRKAGSLAGKNNIAEVNANIERFFMGNPFAKGQ